MKLGVVIDGGPDHFIREFLKDWSSHYEVEIPSFREIKLPLFQKRVDDFRKKRALRLFLERNDVVFFEWAGPVLIAASRLPASAKIITRLHSWELWQYGPSIEWQAVDRVILVGRGMDRHFGKMFPEQAAKTTVISNGVRMEDFQPTYKSHGGVIGMLGLLVPIKRVYEAILAMHKLRSRGFDFKLRLGGLPRDKGADNLRYYAALNYLVEKLDLTDHVRFEGYIEHAEEFLNQLDIFISNSFWESQHVALSEAMASGCFCLGHGWDGIEDILPAENIYFTNAELIEKIIDYWHQPEEVKVKKRSHLREIACQKFDINLIAPKIRRVIEEQVGELEK